MDKNNTYKFNLSFDSKKEYEKEKENFLRWYEKNEGDSYSLDSLINKLSFWYQLQYGTSKKITDKDFDLLRKRLTDKQQKLLEEPTFPGLIYINNLTMRHFHFSSDSVINDASDASCQRVIVEGGNAPITLDKVLNGVKAKDAQKLAEEKGFRLDWTNVNRAIKTYDYRCSIWHNIYLSTLFEIYFSEPSDPLIAFSFLHTFEKEVGNAEVHDKLRSFCTTVGEENDDELDIENKKIYMKKL